MYVGCHKDVEPDVLVSPTRGLSFLSSHHPIRALPRQGLKIALRLAPRAIGSQGSMQYGNRVSGELIFFRVAIPCPEGGSGGGQRLNVSMGCQSKALKAVDRRWPKQYRQGSRACMSEVGSFCHLLSEVIRVPLLETKSPCEGRV